MQRGRAAWILGGALCLDRTVQGAHCTGWVGAGRHPALARHVHLAYARWLHYVAVGILVGGVAETR